MERTISNGKVILDGTEPLFKKEAKIFEKMEEIETIESELGIDIITLWKAIQNGAYFKRGRTIVFVRFDLSDIDTNLKQFNLFNTKKWEWEHYGFCQYGKKWALTKEELK